MINDSKVTVDQMITGSFVKYKRLSVLVNGFYDNSRANKMSIYIDMNSAIKKLYSINSWGYKYKDKLEMTAAILNMCGHYRNFFRYLGVDTNIFIIYGNNVPSFNEQYLKDYNHRFVQNYFMKTDITEMIKANIDALKLITPYIPGVYFFDIGNNEVSAMIEYILNYTKSDSMEDLENLIITKDILCFQLIPEHPRLKILRPMKLEDDESYIIDNSNLWDKFLTKYRNSAPRKINIGTGFIQNVLPMTNVKERSMYSILSIPQAINILDKLVNDKVFGIFENNKFYDQSAINTACAPLVMSLSKYNAPEVELRYKGINPRFQANFVLTQTNPELKILRFQDIEDVQALHKVMIDYFESKGIPVDLEKL